MEEEKAAAYYDELTRKGEGAARFKQGLGFTASSNDAASSRGSALSSSSSYLSTFVKSSSPSKASELQKEAQLASIQNKLKKQKPKEAQSQSQSFSRVSRDRESDDSHTGRRSRDRHSRLRSRSRSRDRRSRRRSQSRDRDSYSRRRSRSRSRSRSRDDHRQRQRQRRGHRSRSRSRSISRERDRERIKNRRRSRSESPKRRRSEKSGSRNGSKDESERIHNVDYAKLIEGYDKMMPAERVKAKMKLQISETVKKDEANMGSGWERFDFDKDAPLDDEEVEAAEDDATLVKHIGQSFRFSAVEARKEDELKAAHDKAMFGAPLLQLSREKNEEDIETMEEKASESAAVTDLISDQVLTMHQGSWRDRIRKT